MKQLITLFTILFFMASSALTAQTIIYVTESGTGDGSSWENAMGDLQAAVDAAAAQTPKAMVWVAAGTYYGDGIAGNNAFTMREGVNVYGNFAGNEAATFDYHNRQIDYNNETILDGSATQRVLYQPEDFMIPTTWAFFTISSGQLDEDDAAGAGAYVRENGELYMCDFLFCTITGFNAKGAAIFVEGGTISNCYFWSNAITESGGKGIGICAYDAVITSCTVDDNTGFNCIGGGIFAHSSTLDNCSSNYNILDGDDNVGAGAYAYGTTITNCSFIQNTGHSGLGGGLYADSCFVENCSFEYNLLEGYNNKGAGLYAYQTPIINVWSTYNTISGGAAAGVGIYVEESFLQKGHALNNELTGNSGEGVGIYALHASMDSVEISSNRASASAAPPVSIRSDSELRYNYYYGIGVFADDCHITNCTISRNIFNQENGGMVEKSVQNAPDRDVFDLMGNYGGGIYATHSYVELCDINYNESDNGGGITANKSTFVNCAITSNSAVDYGSGVITMDSCRFVNCNVVSNADNDFAVNIALEGIYNMGNYNRYDNCIIWDNKGTQAFDEHNTNIYNHCAITGGHEGLQIINLDPVKWSDDYEKFFVAFHVDGYESYELTPQSACVNAGEITDINLPATDLLGQPRIVGGILDIGAYECQGIPECERPLNVHAEILWNNRVIVTWNQVPNAVAYLIYRNSDTIPSATLTDTTYLDSTTIHGLNYLYKVKAVYADSCISYHAQSNKVSIPCGENGTCTIYVYKGVSPTYSFAGWAQEHFLDIYVNNQRKHRLTLAQDIEYEIDTLEFCSDAEDILQFQWINTIEYLGEGYIYYDLIIYNENNDTLYNNHSLSIFEGNLLSINALACSPCLPPVNISTENITMNAATVIWSSTDSTITDWTIEYGEVGVEPGLRAVIDISGRPVFRLTDLRQNTAYEYRIRTNCSEQDFSPWSQTMRFTTLCGTDIPIVYVKQIASGLADGSSWENAMADIADAQAKADTMNPKAMVWVARGTYYGNTTYDITRTSGAFYMTEGVNVYGGFAGNEAPSYNLEERDFVTNETVLDGNSSKRVLHQLTDFNPSLQTTWDGFTIQHGHAGGYLRNQLDPGSTYDTTDLKYGGGALLRDGGHLSHCVITKNEAGIRGSYYYAYGGGVYAAGQNISRTTISNCTITDNVVQERLENEGGGIHASRTMIINCKISNNKARSTSPENALTTWCSSGGGVYANSSIIIGCEISNNTIGGGDTIPNSLQDPGHGGGVFLNGSTIINSTIVQNCSGAPYIEYYCSHSLGVGVYSLNSYDKIINCIIWGNRMYNDQTNDNTQIYLFETCDITYTAVEARMLLGTGNMILASANTGNDEGVNYADFVSPSERAGCLYTPGNFSLTSTSDCIGSGIAIDENFVYNVDMNGQQRISGSSVDMGAYEFQQCTAPAQPVMIATNNSAISPNPANGRIAITSPSGNDFEFSINGIDFQTDSVFENLSERSYLVTVRYVNEPSCSSSKHVVIYTEDGVVINAIAENNSPICSGNTLSLTGGEYVEGYHYSWSGPNGFTSNEMSPTIPNAEPNLHAGDYILFVSDGRNHFAQDTTTVSFLTSFTDRQTISVCSTDFPFYFGDSLITEAGFYRVSFPTENYCDSIVSLTVNTYPDSIIVLYDTICQGQQYDNYGFSLTADETQNIYYHLFQDTLVNTNGCDSIVTLHLRINPMPTAPILSSDSIFSCLNEPNSGTIRIMEYENAYQYQFSIDGVNYQNDTLFTDLAAGNYTVSVRQTLIPACVASANINVVEIEDVPVAQATANSPICNNGTLQLLGGIAGEGTRFSWFGPMQYYSTEQSPSISGENALSGMYYLMVEDAHGCTATDSVEVVVNEATEVVLNDTICQGQQYDNYGFSLTADETQNIYYHLFQDTLVNANGCDSIVTLHLNINPMPSAPILASDSIFSCLNEPNSGTIRIMEYENAYQYQFSIDGVNYQNDTLFTDLAAGNYTVSVRQTLIPACVASANINVVEIEDVPVAQATANSPICNNGTLQLQGGIAGEGTSFSWFGPMQYYSTEQSPSISGENALSGMYYLMVEDAHGCTATDSVEVVVNEATEVVLNDTICQGQQYDNYGFSLTADETQNIYYHLFQDTLVNTNGCDSIVTLHLSINPAITAEFSETVCSSYTWNGTTYTESGDYVQTFPAINDCDSTVTLHLTINLPVEYEFTDNACDNYTWNDETYTLSGDYEQIFESNSGCDSIVTLHLTIHPSYEIIINDTICFGEDYTENGFEIMQPGVGIHSDTISSTSAFNCDSIVIIILTVNALPEIEISGSTEIQQGESITLTASGADTYLWNNGETTESITVSPTESTTYSVTGTNSMNCVGYDSVTVNVVTVIDNFETTILSIYPNPASQNMTIKGENMKQVEIHNSLGQLMYYQKHDNKNEAIISVSQYAEGIYFVKIYTTDSQIFTSKILIQR